MPKISADFCQLRLIAFAGGGSLHREILLIDEAPLKIFAHSRIDEIDYLVETKLSIPRLYSAIEVLLNSCINYIRRFNSPKYPGP